MKSRWGILDSGRIVKKLDDELVSFDGTPFQTFWEDNGLFADVLRPFGLPVLFKELEKRFEKMEE